MNNEDDKLQEIKIVDKRRFTTDGESSSTSANSQQTAQSTQSQIIPPLEKSSEQKKETSLEAKEEQVAASKQKSEPKVEFSSFLMSLATQALVMLGEIPNPETRLTSMNLGAARQTIDILAMLEQKTQGNLTREEKQMLDELLSSLRMAFVEKVRSSGGIVK